MAGRLQAEEHEARISQIVRWVVEGLPKRDVFKKIRETFKIKKNAPVWYKRALAELNADQPDLADLRTEAVEKARELYRKAYAEGNIGEANKALALLARLTGIEDAPGDNAKEIIVRFAGPDDKAPEAAPRG